MLGLFQKKRGGGVLNEIGCWRLDWTAIGAAATAGASVVALWVGLEPRRILKGQQRLLEEQYLEPLMWSP